MNVVRLSRESIEIHSSFLTYVMLTRKRTNVGEKRSIQLGLKLFEYVVHLSDVKLPQRNSFFEWGRIIFLRGSHVSRNPRCDLRRNFFLFFLFLFFSFFFFSLSNILFNILLQIFYIVQ